MAIPPFDNEGLLPLGVQFGQFEGDPIYTGHPTTVDEVEDRLVNRFPDSLTRPALFKELENLHHQAHECLDCFILVVSGEFVTGLDDPQSIFIALEVTGEDIDKVSSTHQWLLNKLFDGRDLNFSANDLNVQTGIGRAYPPDHVKWTAGHRERMLQRLLAGSPVPGTEAGYVEIFDCEGRLENVREVFEPAPS